MRSSRHRLLGFSLLLVFIAGGLVAPVVHRPLHVAERQHRHGGNEARWLAQRQAHPVQAGSFRFFVEEHTARHAGGCVLCARTLTVPAMPAPGALDAYRLAPWLLKTYGSTNLAAVRSRAIRAPPALS